MGLQGNPTSWETGSRIALIRDALSVGSEHVPGVDRMGKSKCAECRRAARHFYDSIGTEPFVYETKVDGVMRPLPQGKERWRLFGNSVREVHSYLAKYNGPSEPSEPTPEPVRPVVTIRPRPVKVGTEHRARVEELYRLIQINRAFVRSRKDMESLDSMRIVIDGTRAVLCGIPAEAIVSSIQAPWSAETRLHAKNFKPSPEQMTPVIPVGTYDFTSFGPRVDTFAHGTAAYVDAQIMAGNLVWLHGPAGTGKSSAAKYAAKRHAERRNLTGKHTGGRTYFEVNCAGAMVSAVKGRDTMQGTVVSDFMLAYEFGGSINLEEFDSAHPSLGTFLGTALAASDGFVNDIMGRFVKRHPDFRCIITANSLGYGDAKFKRNDLDAATKDRFRAGRVFVGLDLELERSIVDSIVDRFEAEAIAA